MNLSKLLKMEKKEDKKAREEFEKKIKQVNSDFVQFQLDREVRAVIKNQYQNNESYPPNVIIDLITSFCVLAWRPMSEEEKTSIRAKLVEQAGIILPK